MNVFYSNFRVTADDILPRASTPAPSGLVSLWRAEGNANDAADGNHGVLRGGAGYTAGVVGQAFHFDGTNSYVEVPDAPSLRVTNELTIEFWVKRVRLDPPGIPFADFIIEKGGDESGSDENYAAALHHSQHNYCLAFCFKGGVRGGGSVADTNNWHHCAVVARNGDADPTLYIDGVAQPVTYREGAGTINLNPSTRPLHIGAQVDPVSGWTYYSRTLVDELSVYSRALSAAEILAIYSAGSAGKRIPVGITDQPASQLGYWGKSVTFQTTVVGTEPFSYQWQKAGTAISGATNSTLTLANLQMTDGGSYAVVVTDAYGSVTSSPAILTMNPAGTSVALYAGVTIDGVPGLTYGIQSTTDLSDTNSWRGLVNITLWASKQLWFDVEPATQPQRYYRVLAGPIPIP